MSSHNPKLSRTCNTTENGSLIKCSMLRQDIRDRGRDRQTERIVIKLPMWRRHENSPLYKSMCLKTWLLAVLSVWAYRKMVTFNCEVLVKQRWSLKSQGFWEKRYPPSKTDHSLHWNCLPFHLNQSAPSQFWYWVVATAVQLNEYKSLPALPMGAQHQSGGLSPRLFRHEFQASLQEHSFIGEGQEIPEISNLSLSIWQPWQLLVHM